MRTSWRRIALAVVGCLGGGHHGAHLLADEPPPAKSRLGMNLSGPADWNTEHPFVDVFRLSREWISQRKGTGWGRGPKLDRDAQGWIKQLEADCWAETPILTGGHAPRGEYVCLYQGDGDLGFSHNARVVSREPGRVVVHLDPRTGGTFLQLKRTNPQDYVRHIRVLMPGFEKTAQAAPFHPAFLDRWRGFNTFRFMDWQETKYLDSWRDVGGDLLCIFASTGSWSKWGSWGLLEFADQTESDIPKCHAVLEWNRKNLRP